MDFTAGYVDRSMKDVELVFDKLRLVQARLNIRSNEVAETAAKMMPKFRETLSQIKAVEAETIPINWERWEDWIKEASEMHRQRMRLLANWFASHGLDISQSDISEAEKMMESIKKSSVLQVSKREGSNSDVDRMLVSAMAHDAFDGRPLDLKHLQKIIVERTDKVMCHWQSLRRLRDDGSFALFKEKWSRFALSDRHAWLKQHYPKFPQAPHAHICAWVDALEPTSRRPAAMAFLTPHLNVDDLANGDVLTGFLETRARIHPIYFLAVDGKAATLWTETGYLKPIAPVGRGVLLLTPTDEGYHVAVQQGIPSLWKLREEADLGIGVCCLQAQLATYAFLVGCVTKLLGDHELEVVSTTATTTTSSSSDGNGNEQAHLSTQSRRLDYYKLNIDTELLKDLIEASLDDAKHSLWQLRLDPELWWNRIKETPATHSGRVLNLLHPIFRRIGSFYVLKQHLADVQDLGDRLEIEPKLQALTSTTDREVLRPITVLHHAISAMFKDEQDRLQAIGWSPSPGIFSPRFSQLFNMVKDNHPTLKWLGLHAIMRIIDREIDQNGAPERIPSMVSQSLDHLSVLAICLRETYKHYRLVTDYDQQNLLIEQAEEQWKSENCWSSVLTIISDKLGNHKLSVEIHNENIGIASRHRTFWKTVDECASDLPEFQPVIDEIQRMAPIDMTPLATDHQSSSWDPKMQQPAPQPTATQLRRSKGSKGNVVYQTTTRTMPSATTTTTRAVPVIKPPGRHRQFWIGLAAPSSENRTSVDWDDFKNAMEGLGYVMTSVSGSNRMFRAKKRANGETPGAIKFHEPHGTGKKLSHVQAQIQWLKRTETRFNLDLR